MTNPSETMPKGMALLEFCTRYLNFAERYVFKTFDEKRTLCRRIVRVWGEEISVDDITPDVVLDYLEGRAKSQSANAYNKDRKNLLAMWNWGQKYHGITNNPIAIIDKRPWDRQPQYCPSTQEILQIITAAEPDNGDRTLVWSYVLTGARRDELLRWQWHEDINFEKRMYRLGTRKTMSGEMRFEWFQMADRHYEELQWWV